MESFTVSGEGEGRREKGTFPILIVLEDHHYRYSWASWSWCRFLKSKFIFLIILLQLIVSSCIIVLYYIDDMMSRRNPGKVYLIIVSKYERNMRNWFKLNLLIALPLLHHQLHLQWLWHQQIFFFLKFLVLGNLLLLCMEKWNQMFPMAISLSNHWCYFTCYSFTWWW